MWIKVFYGFYFTSNNTSNKNDKKLILLQKIDFIKSKFTMSYDF